MIAKDLEQTEKQVFIKPLIAVIALFFLPFHTGGCAENSNIDYGTGSDGGDDSGSDTDTDTDTDTDSDTDVDTDTYVPPDELYQWHTFRTTRLGGINRDVEGNLYLFSNFVESWTGPNGEPPLVEADFSKCENTPNDCRFNWAMKLDEDFNYVWHSFYDYGAGFDTDLQGNIYHSNRDDFCPDSGEVEPINDNGSFFVYKQDTNGDYVWHTFLGDSGGVRQIHIQNNGDIVAVGNASYGPDKNWNGPQGQPPIDKNGDYGIVVVKLGSDGQYKWHTYHGIDIDGVDNVATDSDGNIFVAGSTRWEWTGPDGQEPVSPFIDAAFMDTSDIYILKLGPDGSYKWHTFYGRELVDDSPGGLAVSNGGAVLFHSYVRPNQVSAGPCTISGIDGYKGKALLKLDPDGSAQWHAFIGGVAVFDKYNDIYLCSSSSKLWLGPNGEAPLDPPLDDTGSISLTKIGADGSYKWHAFYGHSVTPSGVIILDEDDDSILISGVSEEGWEGPEGEEPLNPFDPEKEWNSFFIKLKE